ncbi:MAG: helix-turn-helix transcriptional regulator [Staphylococcus epidermidis]|uniref:helix-turn-helix transcriptional regulator n=1 Tax=Enterococcus faecalis TaxID=1351 RepID=UPI000666CCFB|nr:helix-turn-helix transcriptional regulator [Enterococcus faecalis]MDU5306908.1 helix-turn-helix transcriptional regulator [Staphylococcus epidermidis]MDU5315171.1 helix-turn-helix transcriptional regulator [Enterococcus faecalis]MDU6310819.1 helix-turn-helix transcriptional regulator [Enterococcus faecalis]
MEYSFRKRLRELRGKKSKEKFSQELGMSRPNYSRIEDGKSDPTLKLLQKIADETNSDLIIDLVPKQIKQIELELDNEKEQ